MIDSKAEVTRRRLLVLAGSTIALLGASAASCKKGPGSCDDVSSLSADEANTRKVAGYVDQATDEAKTCEKCQQFVAPPSSDQCGTCKVLKGPIHPKGFCNLFVAKP